jgi:hypothetical protein
MRNDLKDIIAPIAVGYWKSEHEPDLPEPMDYIDTNVSYEERRRLIHYLGRDNKYIPYLGYSFCRFSCGKPDVEMGCYDVTDGTYVWPEGLIHYIEEHSVWLPEEFIRHTMLNSGSDYSSIDLRKVGFKDYTWWKNCKPIKLRRTT